MKTADVVRLHRSGFANETDLPTLEIIIGIPGFRMTPNADYLLNQQTILYLITST